MFLVKKNDRRNVWHISAELDIPHRVVDSAALCGEKAANGIWPHVIVAMSLPDPSDKKICKQCAKLL